MNTIKDNRLCGFFYCRLWRI